MSDKHILLKIETLVLIAIGGFVGANMRYLIGTFSPGLVGTLLANAIGSFFLGFVLYEAIYSGLLGERTHLVAATGLLSSFTTYSTFAVETVQAPPLFGVLNVVTSYALGFTAVYLGGYVALSMAGGE